MKSPLFQHTSAVKCKKTQFLRRSQKKSIVARPRRLSGVKKFPKVTRAWVSFAGRPRLRKGVFFRTEHTSAVKCKKRNFCVEATPRRLTVLKRSVFSRRPRFRKFFFFKTEHTSAVKCKKWNYTTDLHDWNAQISSLCGLNTISNFVCQKKSIVACQ